jgi:hypothetical protein
MALTKVTKSGITDNAVDADKIEDGTVLAADLANGAVTADKLASTLDISSKTVTLPNTSVTNAMLAGSIANDKLANSAITVNGASISLGGSVSAGSLEWQAVKTSGFTAVAGEGYFCNTNGGAFIATLPASPSAGDTVAFKDYGDDFATNALTIARNGSNIQGLANDSLISTDRASVVLVYIDATKGWLFTNESNVADLQNIQHIAATGGTITTTGDFKMHAFTGDGNFVVSNAGNVAGSNKVDYFVVAGGGGGHGDAGGGGGGGGFRLSNEYGLPGPTMSPLANPTGLTVAQQTYPVTVGAGSTHPGQATPSVFSTITSAGGGSTNTSGGSGGGARANGPASGATGNDPPVSPPQGNDGGTNAHPVYSGAAGGGGAGAAGSNNPSTAGGPGGVGSYVSTTFAVAGGTPGPVGSTKYYSGGGGGAYDGTPGPAGTGGSGGGGAGNNGAGVNGTANTGGGAGGGKGGTPNASTGGKGIVILRYKFQN